MKIYNKLSEETKENIILFTAVSIVCLIMFVSFDLYLAEFFAKLIFK